VLYQGQPDGLFHGLVRWSLGLASCIVCRWGCTRYITRYIDRERRRRYKSQIDPWETHDHVCPRRFIPLSTSSSQSFFLSPHLWQSVRHSSPRPLFPRFFTPGMKLAVSQVLSTQTAHFPHDSFHVLLLGPIFSAQRSLLHYSLVNISCSRFGWPAVSFECTLMFLIVS